MQLSRLVSIVALAAVFAAHSATALQVDDKSMNGSNASSFDDPDDKTPATVFSPSHAFLNGNKEGSSNGSVDPSSVTYDYDAASGTYTPHISH